MTDVFSKQKRSEVMSAIRSKNTRPEMAVRSMLHRMGFRFRIHVKSLPGTPDIVLKKHKTVVEVYGCFFHRHSGCKFATNPSSNKRFWLAKFTRNMARDRANWLALRKLGWKTIIVWECELKRSERLKKRLQNIRGVNGAPSS